jgi:hypothetical protein
MPNLFRRYQLSIINDRFSNFLSFSSIVSDIIWHQNKLCFHNNENINYLNWNLTLTIFTLLKKKHTHTDTNTYYKTVLYYCKLFMKNYFIKNNIFPFKTNTIGGLGNKIIGYSTFKNNITQTQSSLSKTVFFISCVIK